MTDHINKPPHYTRHSIEPIDVIEDWQTPHHLSCVLKYIARHKYKNQPVRDLEKARWYLDRYIALLSKNESHD